MLENLPKTYNPKDFEERLYDYWSQNEYFAAHVNKDKKPYTIVMPPPNVTGNLHMGHALNNTIQDILIRWKRMSGYEALWQPGTDHASISTESRVVNKINKEGKTKEEIGREGFLKEAWEWTELYGGNIKNQLKKLGVSCDWSRDRFTLDQDMSKAVEEVFIRLYEKGLIYRGDRIINWCPNCATAISDIEVVHEDSHSYIWYVNYPIKDSDEYITIATTRPETILGDLAVAVHPKDDRYKDLVGKTLILPLVNREIPIIADNYVDMEFGSGAVKITPSHDPNDYEVGERFNLGQCVVIDEKGFINSNGGIYEGLDRFEARTRIVEDLKSHGFLSQVKEHDNAVGHCERCDTIIESIISKQWFVKMEPLAKPALDAYYNGELRFIPERFGKVYVNWLENIKDWCISRQLWWGHRLPVYYCDECKEAIVSRIPPDTCSSCSGVSFTQDSDTLDTWFSSALWPFSTLGWPEETADLKYFFPTDALVTGYDIIFFWVARMVFSSLELMGELPFKDVFLTGLIKDSQGRKMSKSLGNGIDPLEIIDIYGADALRFTLVTGNTPGNDMRFYIEKVEANRNFANKLWNATRFVLMNLDEDVVADEFDLKDLEQEDKWIISRLNDVIRGYTENLERYEIGLAAQRIYDFVWDEYCDWYIEMVKSRLYGDDIESNHLAQRVLLYVLKDINRLLHPFMPFITEEIWQHLPDKEDALIVSKWPQYRDEYRFTQAEKSIEFVKTSIKSIRNARIEMDIASSKKASILFVTESEETKNIIINSKRYYINLASAEEVQVVDNKDSLDGEYISVVLDKAEAYLPLKELIDYDKEIERLEKEKMKLDGELKRVRGKLSNQGFLSNAPEKVVDAEKGKQLMYEEMMDKVLERLESLINNK